MTVEMGVFKREFLRRAGKERREQLCHTASVEVVYPLGCRLEDLSRFASKKRIPLLEISRWKEGRKDLPMLVLCPELSRGKNGQDLLREFFSQLSSGGIWPKREVLEETYLLVGKREVFLPGGSTYCGYDAMKPPEEVSILNGWQLAYYLPPENGQLLRVGTVVANGFLRAEGPPFLADQNWQVFLSEIDGSLNDLAINLAWTDAVRGNDYY